MKFSFYGVISVDTYWLPISSAKLSHGASKMPYIWPWWAMMPISWPIIIISVVYDHWSLWVYIVVSCGWYWLH